MSLLLAALLMGLPPLPTTQWPGLESAWALGDPNDLDGDGLDDAWESSLGLNPGDPSDAVRDFDYDRVTNLDEEILGTSPNTGWSTVHLTAGGVETLNEFGEIVRLGSGNQILVSTGGRWSALASFGTGWTPTSIRQNSRGLCVAWNMQPNADLRPRDGTDLSDRAAGGRNIYGSSGSRIRASSSPSSRSRDGEPFSNQFARSRLTRISLPACLGTARTEPPDFRPTT